MSSNPSANDRFCEALRELLALNLTTVNAFCREIGYDKRNFYHKMEHNPPNIPAPWMTHLVLRYGVSADWLLTGRGWMFGQ